MTDRPHDRPETSHPTEHRMRDRSRDDGRVWVPWSEIELPDELEAKAAEFGTGWDAPGVVDNPDRPDPESIHLEPERRSYILDGYPNGTGGGHRYGTERPGKTEFPERWDDDTVCAYITEVVHDPDVVFQQNNRRWSCSGTRDGVEIVVKVWPEGKIWSAWPLPGGDGVKHNPPEGN